MTIDRWDEKAKEIVEKFEGLQNGTPLTYTHHGALFQAIASALREAVRGKEQEIERLQKPTADKSDAYVRQLERANSLESELNIKQNQLDFTISQMKDAQGKACESHIVEVKEKDEKIAELNAILSNRCVHMEKIASLESLNEKLAGILRMALSDDNYHDHSSGIWQTDAKKALNRTRRP